MKMSLLKLLVIHICGQFLWSSIVCSKSEKPLRLLGLLPSSGGGWAGGQACLAPVQMALEDIKKHGNILNDYNLEYSWIDTMCDPGVGVYRMFQQINNNPPYIMLMGDGCSIVAEATSQVSYLLNLTQISYGSSSPVLSDRKRFPKFFRVVGPDHMLNPARIALMRYFNWKKVATINEAREFFSVVTDDLANRVRFTDITVESQEIFGNDPTTRVENLQKHDARIIVTAMYEDKARMMLCVAYKLGHYGPRIVWMFVGWFSSHFWKANLDDIECTAEEMDAVAEGSLITRFFARNPLEQRGIANMTASEFDARLVNYPTYRKDLSHYDFVTARCYDHTWAVALALHCADKKLKDIDYHKTLDEFNYDYEVNEVIFECMGNLSLIGVSGNIDYGAGADPIKNIGIEQIQGGTRRPVGRYRMDSDPMVFEWEGEGIQWKDGHVPRDSTYVLRSEVTIPLPVYIPLTICSALGMVVALTFLAFNVVHRNNPTVKLSSPNINNVLLVGCILCYTTVFMKPTETNNSAVCKTKIFCFAFGFTTAFGALFSKTWRVYRIFTNKKLLRMSIKDYQLLAIISGLLVVVLTVLIIWELVSPHEMVVQSLHREIYVLGNDIEVRPFVRMCHSEKSAIFSWILYILEGALLSFGAFLAWETRNVKIEALNDSHQIGLCLYNVVVLSAVGLTLTLLLDQQIIILYGMTSSCLIIGTTVTQVVVFVPKVLAVYQKSAVVDIGMGGSRDQSSRFTFSNSVKTTPSTQQTNQDS